ncbi:hypothetical protein [Leuconostoc pseudomesenteroides]|nr:hypothetical protein [Leuconostoc pseudomesenteroides]
MIVYRKIMLFMPSKYEFSVRNVTYMLDIESADRTAIPMADLL